MSTKNDPAFPVIGAVEWPNYPGLTAVELAAIKLQVPESGTDWLDAMIRRANRDRFAGMALQGLLGNSDYALSFDEKRAGQLAAVCFQHAEAMLAESEKRREK